MEKTAERVFLTALRVESKQRILKIIQNKLEMSSWMEELNQIINSFIAL